MGMGIDSKTLLRMKKLLTLAKQGVGGEAENAERFLANMLAKHGLAMADIVDDAMPASRVALKFRDRLEERLINQVVSKVLDSMEWPSWKRGKERAVIVELTAGQHAEVLMHLAVLEPALRRHMKRAFAAFVQTNRLFPESPSDISGNKMDPAELAMILAMAAGSEKVQVRKALRDDATPARLRR